MKHYVVLLRDGTLHDFGEIEDVEFHKSGTLILWGRTDGSENCGIPVPLMRMSYPAGEWKSLNQETP